MQAPSFATIVAALAWWQGHTPPRDATIPPCDVLGDEAYDVMLAVVFRDLVPLDSLVARLGRIDAAIQANQPMVAYCRARGAEDAACRIEAMLLVLSVWATELAAEQEVAA